MKKALRIALMILALTVAMSTTVSADGTLPPPTCPTYPCPPGK